MTLAEAIIYFPIESDELDQDDLVDLYDERLFEYKQFFLSKAIVKKVFVAKLQKLQKFQEAYSLICEKPFLWNEPIIDEQVFSTNVRLAFEQFELQKSVIKKSIAQASDANSLMYVVVELIQLHEDYSNNWNIGANLEVEIDALSKEPDSMEILQAIRAFEQDGGITFQDILTIKNHLTLKKEMKRVSLLLQKMNP